jgi:hypothetical protein
MRIAAAGMPLRAGSSVQPHGIGEDLRHERERHEHPRMGMTRTRERLLEQGTGYGAARDLQQEQTTGLDEHDAHQQDTRCPSSLG